MSSRKHLFFKVESGAIDLNGSAGFEESLLAYHGKPVRAPQHPDWKPKAEHLAWHFGEVSKGNARYLAG